MKIISEMVRNQLGLAIQDLAGGKESARISLKELHSLAAVVRVEVGALTTFSATLRQHDAAAAGNSKDLLATIPHYYMVDGDTEWTKVDSDATALKAVAALDTAAGYVAFEVDPSDLDVNNSYSYVSLLITAPGAAKQGHVVYMGEAKRLPAWESAL